MLNMHVLVQMGTHCRQGKSVNILQKWHSKTHGPWCRRRGYKVAKHQLCLKLLYSPLKI